MTIEVSSFIKGFTTPLDYENLSTDAQFRPYVFWDASSSDNGQGVQNMLRTALTNVEVWDTQGIIEFWAPDDDDKLAIAGIFAVTFLHTSMMEHRRLSVSSDIYGLDLPQVENQLMTSPGPFPSYMHLFPRMLRRTDGKLALEVSVMVPVVLPTYLCAGVIEISAKSDDGLETLF